jgi:hypothetical protein
MPDDHKVTDVPGLDKVQDLAGLVEIIGKMKDLAIVVNTIIKQTLKEHLKGRLTLDYEERSPGNFSANKFIVKLLLDDEVISETCIGDDGYSPDN